MQKKELYHQIRKIFMKDIEGEKRMGKSRKQMVRCPKCDSVIEVSIWDKLEMPYDEEQKDKVMRNTFFRVKCSKCEMEMPMLYDCEYNDLERKFMIWVVPQMTDAEKGRIMHFNKRLETDNALRLAQGGYRYRIVKTDNELREKVLIFNEGLDDRFIETMKISYVPIIKKHVGEDCKIMGFFFDKNENGNYQWVVVFDKREPMLLKIDMNIYHDMKEKMWEIAETKTPNGLISVGAGWALDVMNTRVGDIPEMQSEK